MTSWHPSVGVLSLLLVAAWLPRFPQQILWAVVVVAFLAAFVCMQSAYWAFLWRAKWLMLCLCLTLACSTPGQSVFPAWTWWAPTDEGLWLAGRKLAQLLAFMSVWFWWLPSSLKSSAAFVCAGLYGLLFPLHRMGVPVQRWLAGLVLVLEQVAQNSKQRLNWSHLKDFLYQEATQMPVQVMRIGFEVWPLRFADRLMLVIIGSGFGMLWI